MKHYALESNYDNFLVYLRFHFLDWILEMGIMNALTKLSDLIVLKVLEYVVNEPASMKSLQILDEELASMNSKPNNYKTTKYAKKFIPGEWWSAG